MYSSFKKIVHVWFCLNKLTLRYVQKIVFFLKLTRHGNIRINLKRFKNTYDIVT